MRKRKRDKREIKSGRRSADPLAGEESRAVSRQLRAGWLFHQGLWVRHLCVDPPGHDVQSW